MDTSVLCKQSLCSQLIESKLYFHAFPTTWLASHLSPRDNFSYFFESVGPWDSLESIPYLTIIYQ